MRRARRRPYVVYWNNIPSPYMVERFNAFVDEDGYDFEAWFNERTDASRSWAVDERSWRFRYRYIPSWRVFGIAIRLPTPVLGRRPDVIVSLYAEPVFLLGWLLARLRGSKIAFWCVMTADSWVRRSRWKDWVKRWVFPRVDALLSPGGDGRAYALRFGAREDRVWTLEHSIDVEHFVSGRERFLPERDELRQAAGLKGTTFVYVGRLWWGKGLTHLIDAFEKVQGEESLDVSLLLVGDGPDEAALRRSVAERGLRNVVFAGFQTKDALPRFYAMADVFVFPTLGDPYGLVVDEAMASSLPIVSTTAAGEIEERVLEGVNGYLVPPGDGDALAERMAVLVGEPAIRSEMGRRSVAGVLPRTPQRWARDFEAIVDRLLGG